MFGESESESPRAGSPWDSFLEFPKAPSPSIKYELHRGVGCGLPKLIPELDEGNVEYKLKLITPSPERFARLVTQLKWRLLEGGGQAYYELGVADSGHLVGLSRQELGQSLETLEEMAGEIGASVVVVKEIEVPIALIELSEKKPLGLFDEAVRAARRNQGRLLFEEVPEGEYSTATDADTETDLSTPDVDETGTNFDNVTVYYAKDTHIPHNVQLGISCSLPQTSILASRRIMTRSQSQSPNLTGIEGDVDIPTIELEIAAVYKPRPMRRRKHKDLVNRSMMKAANRSKEMNFSADGFVKGDSNQKIGVSRPSKIPLSDNPIFLGKPTKHKHRSVVSDGTISTETADKVSDLPYIPTLGNDKGMDSIVTGLDALHIPLADLVDIAPLSFEGSSQADDSERRLIVEALVVRKMSLEEVFLDFGGFSLTI